MATVLGAITELALETREKNPIKNEIVWDDPRPGDEMLVDDYKRQFARVIHRTRSSRKYNCHGLVFASRRTQIWDSAEVSKILADDSYVRIPLSEVLVGDVALYVDQGDVQQCGLRLANLRPSFQIATRGSCLRERIPESLYQDR